MIARMPVRSPPSSSERSKPSRLSISSWFRIRSDCGSPPGPRPLSASKPAASTDGSAVSSGSSAMRQSDRWRSLAGALVDQHLLDQYGVGLGRRDHQVDPAQDLHAQLIGALAPGQVLGPKLTQEGL